VIDAVGVGPSEIEIDETPAEIVADADLKRIGDGTAFWVYSPVFETAVGVNAESDPRPCLEFIVDTPFGPGRLDPCEIAGPDPSHCRITVPDERRIDDRLPFRPERKLVGVCDADPLPSVDDPVGRDPVTGYHLDLVEIAFSVVPWARHDCVECGFDVEEITGEQCPDGWRHAGCDPSHWADADLTSFATDGGEQR